MIRSNVKRAPKDPFSAGIMTQDKPTSPLGEEDYEAIESAVMETARGRWFLSEFARRNRTADTAMLPVFRVVEVATCWRVWSETTWVFCGGRQTSSRGPTL